MTSEKQVAANRKNALKSRGPKTAAGKMIASRNSIKHGFYATTVLLPDDDRDEFVRLGRRLAAAYMPVTTREEVLVKSIIETEWQLRRANLVDTELFQMYRFYDKEQGGVGVAFAHDASQANAFSKLTRYQSFLLRKLQSAKNEFNSIRAGGEQSGAYLGLANGQSHPVIPAAPTSLFTPTDELLGSVWIT